MGAHPKLLRYRTNDQIEGQAQPEAFCWSYIFILPTRLAFIGVGWVYLFGGIDMAKKTAKLPKTSTRKPAKMPMTGNTAGCSTPKRAM